MISLFVKYLRVGKALERQVRADGLQKTLIGRDYLVLYIFRLEELDKLMAVTAGVVGLDVDNELHGLNK
jgi:hypothetical protein